MQQHQNKIKCHVTRHSLYCCKSQKYLAVAGSSSEQHAEQGATQTFLPLKISVSIKIFRSQWHSLSYDEWTETWFQKFQALQLRSLPSKDPICYVPLSEPNAYIQITAIGYSRSTSCVAKISIPVFNYFHNAKIHTTKPLLSEPNKLVKQFALGVFVVYPYEVIQSSKSESDKQRTTETNRSMKMLMYGSSKTTSNKRIVL